MTMPLMYDCEKVHSTSFWPEAGPVDNRDIGLARPDGHPFEYPAELGEEWTRRAWRLDLCRDGTLSLRARDEEPFNGVAMPVAYASHRRDLELAQRALGTFKPQRPDRRLTYEGGRRYMWSGWLPGTAWQLSAVARVLHMFLRGDQDEAVRELLRLSKLVEEAAAREGLRLNGPEEGVR
uniref:hypothetical protein n=1 Tax=Nonomuraea sp. CA-251285 TaxID=3240002 RepID=UPI003F494685